MNDTLIFEMGLYKATFPTHLCYTEIHFWLQPMPGGTTRCGLTSYAARLLGDLFSLDWKVYTGELVQIEQLLGEVESTKASSELYSPMQGKLADINSAAVDDPSAISIDPYGIWLFEFEGAPGKSLSPHEYLEFLAAGWDETVKLMKGQA